MSLAMADEDDDSNISNIDEFENIEENILKREIAYLKIIIRHKDFIIRKLQGKIQLIQAAKLQHQEKDVNKPFPLVTCPLGEPSVIIHDVSNHDHMPPAQQW
ncbi:hypothetical protein JTB14_014903 [Gonioctena quinquepunctata]|nr:hypothetical protein JTB14_014903 [Gonioctena quinquepunctata]